MSSPEPRSIHYRRRWAYALWVLLLAVAGGALVAWRIPVRRGEGHLVMALHIPKAPPGARVDLWCGPASRWKPGTSTYPISAGVSQEGPTRFGPMPVAIARRRWVKVFHPETADLINLRFSVPGGASSFAQYHLAPDLYSGLLAERRKLTVELTVPWGSLSPDPVAPSNLQ